MKKVNRIYRAVHHIMNMKINGILLVAVTAFQAITHKHDKNSIRCLVKKTASSNKNMIIPKTLKDIDAFLFSQNSFYAYITCYISSDTVPLPYL